VNATLRGRIAGGDDDPLIGQRIFPELSVEHQLVAARLGHLRRGGQLIEKEDALARRREELRRDPFRLIRRNSWQAAQVDRIELHGPYIEKVVVEIVGDLRDDLRFSDATGAPNVQGYAFANERVKRLIELRWFHGISLRV
jgi:hypothetical protein